METLTKIDNIKELYSQVKQKTKFMIVLANEVGNKPGTLKTHWFREFWSIPEEHQDTTIDLLQKTIKNQ